MTHMNRTHARWTTTLAAAASIALAASGFAQTVPPAQPAPAVNQDLAKKHLTAARNVLNEVTQLPAAAQLTGDARTQVQQLISNFNELITKDSEWRDSYAKVESNLAALLGPTEPAAATDTAGAVGTTGTAGAVGTTGTASAIDPAIRAKLMEIRTHLDQFEAVVDGAAAPSPEVATTPMPAATASAAATGARPDSPPATNPSTDPATNTAQEVTVVSKELLDHVEALEVILGAQTVAQKAATTAAGGAVVSNETVTGSTRTTVTGPDVTLNADQLAQIKTHLKELRRLLEKK
jgi:hypothetical protein